MIEWIIANKEWFFSGIGVTILGILFIKFRPLFSRQDEKKNELDNSNEITNTNSISNINHVNIDVSSEKTETKRKKKLTKNNIKVVFIDDEKFKTVDNLKAAGYLNTKTIKDVKDLDTYELKNADIIFIDINGVGESLFPQDKGLGLAEALKRKYPDKYITIYSAQEQGNRFHKALKVVDNTLPKNAEPYEFINIIDNLCEE